MKLYLTLVFLITSCLGPIESEDFKQRILTRWIGATTIHSLHPYIQQGESIKKPSNTWQKLFAVSFYDKNFQIQHDCLYYLVPNSETSGKLAVSFNAHSSQCPPAPPEKIDLIRENIFNFSYDISLEVKSKHQLKLKVDDDEILFDFINFKTKKYQYSLSSNSVKNGSYIGLRVSSPVDSIKHSTEVSLADGVLCHRLDQDCKTLQNYNCDACTNGWYEIISSDCPNQYNKVCGQNKCGKSGEPACIRGRVATGYQMNYCINDSPIGYCDKGLRVFCNANQLVCR